MFEWLEQNKGAATVIVAGLGLIGSFIGMLTALLSRKQTHRHEIVVEGGGSEVDDHANRRSKITKFWRAMYSLWIFLLTPWLARALDTALDSSAWGIAADGSTSVARVVATIALGLVCLIAWIGFLVVPLLGPMLLFRGLALGLSNRSLPAVLAPLATAPVCFLYFFYTPAQIDRLERDAF